MAFLRTLIRTGMSRWCLLSLLLGCGAGGQVRAQGGCLLVPVPLAQRVKAASLIVEASADQQRAVERAGGHIYTLSDLTVYKVFRGTPPQGLRLAEPGGTLGLRREEVSSAAGVQPGQQGLFLLETDPANPGSYRLQDGPQGLVRYDLATRSAADPFARYGPIVANLYPIVEANAGQPVRLVQANNVLAGPAARALAGAISGFAPASLTAGTNSILTITGSGFGASQGSGRVEFPNADNGGSSFVGASPSDIQQWTDAQIQVRVPSRVVGGGTAGTGVFRVISAAADVLPSPAALTVVYALTNVAASSTDPPNRPRLINDDGLGGYTLSYSPSFMAVAGAPAAFERALASWTCATRLRRVVGATAAPDATALDNANVVRFGSLATNVLGVANSYYSGCVINGEVLFSLDEMDYTFSNTANFQFGPAAPTVAQADFESVALHELGHGTQLSHLIDPTAVMHYVLVSGQTRRVLNPSTDVAAGQNVFAYSATNPCGDPAPVATAVPSNCTSLPVELAAFEARYTAGRGTALSWATASERNSAYFAVEAQEEGGGSKWIEVLRLAAAGSTSSARRYQAHDPRLLTGRRYYRLRQVDLDGSTSYSPVASVFGLETGLALYPNPVADRLQVSGPAQAGRLICYDLAGRAIAQFNLVPGPNSLDVSALPPGLYQVDWTDGQTSRRSRLQKR